MKTILKIMIPILVIFAISNSDAQKIKEAEDPIGNSVIINNLEMESPNNKFADNEEDYGEIIFDNTFYDSIQNNEHSKTKNKAYNSKAFIELKKKDNRWHIIEYKIKKNDSLWSISKKFNTQVSILAEINNIDLNSPLKPDETIFVPSKNGIFYKIKKGDTLSLIAKNYDADIEEISRSNNIDAKRIIAGKTIFIPDAKNLVAKKDKKHKEINIADKKSNKREEIAVNKKDKNSETEGKSKTEYAKLHLSWPIRGPITSGFGNRINPLSGYKTFHCGLDIGAEIGTPVKAAADGRVIFSGWKDAYGKIIVIQHKNDYITVYAHNSELLVDENEVVKKGQKIALSGMTGATTGPHLHFEIRKGIVPLNPLRILK